MNFKVDISKAFVKRLVVLLGVFLFYCLEISLVCLAGYYWDIDYSSIDILFYAICVLCIVITSFLFAAMSSSKGWLNGLLGGASLLLLCAGGYFLIMQGNANYIYFLYKVPLMLLIAVICGVFGINMRH